MKKKWIFLCVMLLLLTGCSAGTKKLRFGAAGLGGVYHIFADTFANVLSTENNDFQIDVKTTAGSAANLRLLSEGYIQLAVRSGYYKRLNVMAIKEGELLHYDPLNEEIEVNLIEDDIIRDGTPTAGYYAMFEYENGFRKTMYWSKKKMLAHAEKYSQAFGGNGGARSLELLEAGQIPEKDLWKYSSFWFKDFDSMALKTMLRQIISKWGIMSIDLQNALDKDMAVIHEDGKAEYVDSVKKEEPVAEQEYREVTEAKTDVPKAAEPPKEADASEQMSMEDMFFNN